MDKILDYSLGKYLDRSIFAAFMMHSISTYFTSPDHLDALSVSEIEALCDEYPYASVYRVLLDKKMNRGTNHSTRLMHNSTILTSDNQVYLENAVEVNSVTRVAHQETTIAPYIEESQTLTPPMKDIQDIKIDEVIDLDIASTVSTEEIFPETEVMDLDKPAISIESKPKKVKSGKKKNKKFKLEDYSGISTYHKWLLSLRDANLDAKIAKQEAKARRKAIEKTAMKSVQKSDTLVSEPLADILAAQGHIEEAKKMYTQLMHKYPEKSAYFAAKINNI
jgi:hypothetical protein